jgi:hypothetical protein
VITLAASTSAIITNQAGPQTLISPQIRERFGSAIEVDIKSLVGFVFKLHYI